MKALPLIVGVLALASLVSCDIGSTGHRSDNLAHFISGFALPGVDFHTAVHPFNGQVYFLASESDQGNTDLNGDGDAADNVVHCLDPDTGTVVNLGVSARRPIVNTLTRLVWSTSEADEGGVDLTGDGDIGDQVLVSYNPALPVGPGNPLVSSVSIDAFSPLGVWGELVVYVASEFDTNTDFNGDIFLDDFVVQVFNATTGSMVLGTTLGWDTSEAALTVGNGVATWLVSETDSGPGSLDLNSDGDTSDKVIFGINLNLLTLFPVGAGGSPRASVGPLPAILGTAAAPVIPYVIQEADEGATSLNGNILIGDNDAEDTVIALFNVNTGVETLPFMGIAVDPGQITGNATRCGFVALEIDNAGGAFADFNTDGDTDDEVPFWVNLLAPGTAYSLGLAANAGDAMMQICDEYMVFGASEIAQGSVGTNHNAASGDADVDDIVAFYTDISAVGVPSVNTGWATFDFACFSGRFFVFTEEASQNDTDLTGDDDTDDDALIYFLAGGPTPVQGSSVIVTDGLLVFQVCPTTIRIYANLSEAQGFGDLNNDGDELDFIMTVTRMNANTGAFFKSTPVYTCDTDGASAAVVVDGDTVVFPFSEQMIFTGFDANADADAADLILNYIQTTCP